MSRGSIWEACKGESNKCWLALNWFKSCMQQKTYTANQKKKGKQQISLSLSL